MPRIVRAVGAWSRRVCRDGYICPPDAPSGLLLTTGNSQLAATWTAPTVNGGAAVTDFVIEYRTSPAGAWTVFPDGTSTATNTTITGLTYGTTYDVRVSAVNSAGTGSPSPVATATPP